jgi:PIN domain nuclease of toxin-antitoxin system
LTFLDAYPLVALLANEPAADEVEQLLRQDGGSVAIVNLCEAIDVCQRVRALPAAEIRDALQPLLLVGTLVPVASGEAEAWVAADLRARYYDRKERALSLADCILLAHASTSRDGVATSDPAVVDVARAEGVGVVALPNSAGVRP